MQDALTTEVVQDTTQQEQPTANEVLQQHFWDGNAAPQPAEEVKQVEQKQESVTDPPPANEWWKSFEFDSEETAKSEIARLKQVKPQEEILFANDESKKFFEYIKEGKTDDVYSYLQTQKTLNKLLDGDIDESKAADIIKYNLASKYKEFSQADVERKFNKQYGIPKEPIQTVDELDDEFKARYDEWKEKVSEIKADMILDAKVVRPEIAKFKSELVLPDIAQNPITESKRQPTQEELANDRKMKDEWVKAATDFSTKFNGFSTVATYKENGKDVEIPVNYGLSVEEKKLIGDTVSKFVESGFDPMAILKERWIDEGGNDKIDQVVKDLSWLLFGEKAAQKFANEASNQRLDMYLRDKKNIRVDNTAGNNFGQGETTKDATQRLQESFWGN